jgi:hypothetical protein
MQYKELPLSVEIKTDVVAATRPQSEWAASNDSSAGAADGYTFYGISQGLVNCLKDTRDGKEVLSLRPPFERQDNAFVKAAAPGNGTSTNGRGIYYTRTLGEYLIEVWGNDIWVNGALAAGGTNIFTDDALDGPCGFAEGIDSSGNKYVVICGSNEMIHFDGTTYTDITDGDLPSALTPTPVFLDGYVFVPQEVSRRIYNSNVGDPLNWQASTFIATEESGGNIVALAKHKSYVVALCEDHIEFFKDAAVPSPNSPLLRVSDLSVNIGCLNRATVATVGDDIYFLGVESGGAVGVFQIRDSKVRRVSLYAIAAIASREYGANGYTGAIPTGSWTQVTGASNGTQCYTSGFIIYMNERPFYILNAGSGLVNVSSGVYTSYPSLCYDIENNFWTLLTQPSSRGSDSTVYHPHAGLQFIGATQVRNPSAGQDFVTVLQPNTSIVKYLGVINRTGSTGADFDPAGGLASTPANGFFVVGPQMIVKYSNMNLDTYARKFGARLIVFGHNIGSLLAIMTDNDNEEVWTGTGGHSHVGIVNLSTPYVLMIGSFITRTLQLRLAGVRGVVTKVQCQFATQG